MGGMEIYLHAFLNLAVYLGGAVTFMLRSLYGRGKSRKNLTTYLNLVPKSRMVKVYLHSLIRLHTVALN
jgi:hypothetical protein